MAQNTPQHARNWEIWRRYKFQGARRCDLAREYGVNPGRIDQIVRKHERMALWATMRILKRKDDETLQRLPDHYRDGLLGVEYVFTAEASGHGGCLTRMPTPGQSTTLRSRCQNNSQFCSR